jgi:hypothetical protein
MPFTPFDQAKIDGFFSEIELFQVAYKSTSFRFLAVRCKDDWVLFHGILTLNKTTATYLSEFETDNILAGEIPLSQIAKSPRDFLHKISTIGIELRGRPLVFPAEHSGFHTAFHRSFDGAQNPRDRAGEITINGSNDYHNYLHQPVILRELKTGPVSFNSIAELATYYGMKFDPWTNLHIETIAPSVCEVAEGSHLKLGNASINVRLPAELNPEKVRLALRGRSRDGLETRLEDPNLSWTGGSSRDWLGVADVIFPEGKSITCMLSYERFIQEERVISEPIALSNTLRFVIDLFEQKNEAFERVINDFKIKDRDGRELEAAVAAMLSLVGFRVIAVDHIPGLQEVPDVVAADATGNLLVFECTLNLPNAADKLDKLSRRHETIRQGLNSVGLEHIRTLPVLAVALPRQKIAPYIDDARKAGILLWGREDLHRLRLWTETQTAEAVFAAVSAELDMINLLAANAEE